MKKFKLNENDKIEEKVAGQLKVTIYGELRYLGRTKTSRVGGEKR